ncbi:MAG TPA: LUD domain-containing protein [Bacteroidia bacterium]|nr:LUD domain-containing protein [Bacteroidia bacterium]
MQESTSKEKMLKKIRKALMYKSDTDYSNLDFSSPIYKAAEDSLEITFAQKFSALNGKFIFCENESEFLENFSFLIKDNNWTNVFCFEPSLKNLLKKESILFSDVTENISEAKIGLTTCECLVARTGSVLVSSRQASGRRLPFYSEVHLVVAYSSQLVYTMKEALKNISAKYENRLPSMITAISGVSSTSDIEKTLIQGAHGPREIFVFLIDDITSQS